MFQLKHAAYCLAVICAIAVPTSRLLAQNKDVPASPTGDATTGTSANPLADQQRQLAEKYRRLEDLIFKMADFESATNPRRSALLKKAYKQSKDRLTHTQLNAIAELLLKKRYQRALEGQKNSQDDLQALLDLLLSENRSDRLKTEAQRIKETIKELKRLERLQRSVRGRTEGGGDPKRLAENQQQLADRTGKLADKLSEDAKSKQNGAGDRKESDDNAPKDKPTPDEEKNTDEKPDDQKDGKSPKDPKEGTPSDAKPAGKQGTPQLNQPQPNQPQPNQPPSGNSKPQGQGSPSEQPPQPPQPPSEEETPARKQVREAEDKMREAEQHLKDAKHDESIEKQLEAEEKLKEAIAELEEILRQMREEEVERVLAVLEGRFRQMLEMQMRVHEGTVRLGKKPKNERTHNTDIQANQLAFKQRKIATQADRCLTLLREEGSSVAFPEVVEQMRDDMQEVDTRLGSTKIDQITQELQEDIITTLEELIAALQKAQDKKKDPSKAKSKPSRPGESALVDTLSELKMVRSLQLRVNRRTKRYSRLLADGEDAIGQATDADLRQAIGKLADRQSNVQQITRKMVLGKNK